MLAPTRELANQVADEVAALGRHRGVRTVPIYGGVGYQQQIERIEAGAHVVVGTPGRILDHLGSGRLSFARVRILVFDEADEMLSLGFWPDMREIHKHLPRERQSCLFSATIPERVRSLSRVFLRDPIFVSLSEGQVAPQEIEHFFVLTTAQEKDSNLVRHPRVRGSRERHHLLQHQERRALRDRVPAAARLRRRPDLRRPDAVRARAGDGRASRPASCASWWRRTWPRAASTSAISRT